jgi:hypothetical protein
LLCPQQAAADFDLPILYPVPKTISVPDDVDLKQLQRFKDVKDLTIEIRMKRGNMLSDRLLNGLKNEFKKIRKRIVLLPSLRSVHVERLRQLDNFEVVYRINGSKQITKEVSNALFALGPIRKTIILDKSFNTELYKQIRRMKLVVPSILIDKSFLSKEQLDVLVKDKKTRKEFQLSSDFEFKKLYELTAISPLKLVINTKNNRIDDKLLKVLNDLNIDTLIVVANGKMTVEDARQWAKLKRFTVKIVFDKKMDSIPGLARLLNRISPP